MTREPNPSPPSAGTARAATHARLASLLGRWDRLLLLALAALALLALGSYNASWGTAAAWAICLLIALVGWGAVVERLLGDGVPAGWALRAVWGMAAVLVIGGPLAALHVASRPVLLAQVIVGLLFAAGFASARWPPAGAEREPGACLHLARVVPLVLVAAGFAVVHFVGYLGWNVFQPSDDGPAYFLLPEKLLQTGTMFEPYSVRRLTTYGGQSYLHALYLTVAPHGVLHVVDAGLGFAIVAGLLLSDLPARPSRVDVQRVWLALTLLATLPPINRTNTTSLMTGCALFLGMYQTFRRPWPDSPVSVQRSTIARAVLIGMLVAAAGLLRTSYAVPAAAFGALGLLPGIRELWSRAAVRPVLRTQAIFAGSALVVLLPWLLLFRESCGTAIYPLDRGSLTPGFEFLKRQLSLIANLHSLWGHIFYERPLVNLPLFVLAALLPAAGNDRLVRAASWATFLGFCATVYVGGAFDPFNNSRHYFAFVTAFALIMALTVRRSHAVATEVPIDVRDIVVVVGVLASLVIGRGDVAGYYRYLVEMGERGYRNAAADARASDAKTRVYRDLQGQMQAGARAVMMVDEPFRFDLRRNEMFSLDLAGGMGPSPGYPAFAGAEALRAYLVANGVRYVVYVDFSRSAELYVRASWQNHLKHDGSFLQMLAPYMLDTMDSIEAIARSRTIASSRDGMNLVDLAGSPAP